MRALVSVRDIHEARCVAEAGVPMVDLKDPAQGALGAVAPQRLAALVAEVRRSAGRARLSATVGDWAPDAPDAAWQAAVARVAEAGVDDVKVGVPQGAPARRWLRGLGQLRRAGASVVPVLLVDGGAGPPGVAADTLACALDQGFSAVMLDTQDKAAGSLLARVPQGQLSAFVRAVQAQGVWAGLAGSLPLSAVPALRAIGPDFAGFRSAVCAGARTGALCPERLARLCTALDGGGAGARARARGACQSGIKAEGAKST